MKVNSIIRNVLLLATLSLFSSCPAEASYAIDTNSCNTGEANFIKAQSIRATTIGKFVSLNLNPGAPVGGEENPYGWSMDGYIGEQITLLMGDAQEAYVVSGAFTISCCPAHRICE